MSCLLPVDGPPRDPSRERLALDELHHQEKPSGVLLHSVESRDARVVQRRQELRFPLEPGAALPIAGERLEQDFYSDIALELLVPGPIDFTHSTSAEDVRDR